MLKQGSKEAIDAGCTCPVLDNHHGKGAYGDGEKYGWWVTADCPIHGAFKSLRSKGFEKEEA